MGSMGSKGKPWNLKFRDRRNLEIADRQSFGTWKPVVPGTSKFRNVGTSNGIHSRVSR